MKPIKKNIPVLCLAIFVLALNIFPAAADDGVFEHPADPPEPAMRLTFYIVDETGKPLSNVCGALEYNDGETAMHILPTDYEAAGIPATGKTGTMYFGLIPEWIKKGAYTLKLHAYYDHTLTQAYTFTLPEASQAYKATWKAAAPPTVRPPQKQGIRFFLKDYKTGRPVQGVMLDGSPYSNEARAANKALPNNVIFLGPSDENGYIRWDTAIPGTYELGGEKDLLLQHFTVTMPEGKAMHDIVLSWKPESGSGAYMSWPGN